MLVVRRKWSTVRAHTLQTRGRPLASRQQRRHRSLLTLAIETSCDDTSVAILEKDTNSAGQATAKLHFHEKVTSNNLAYRGVHPAVALVSHQRSLGKLVQQAITHLPLLNSTPRTLPLLNVTRKALPPLDTNERAEEETSPDRNKNEERRRPDFVSVTRGPGMRSNLSVGLDTAKGLSLAWGVPLLAVNHMQAHALTPRLVSALDSSSLAGDDQKIPPFPFLSLLISGGHTLLLQSTSLTTHPIIAQTSDTAIGDYIDKAARDILPAKTLAAAPSAMYGPLLETFAFPDLSTGPTSPTKPDTLAGHAAYAYDPPPSRSAELDRRMTAYGWGLAPPLGQADTARRAAEFSFAGLGSAVRRVMSDAAAAGREVGLEERRLLAREAQRVAFEHLAARVVAALRVGSAAAGRRGVSGREAVEEAPRALVVSGGVAANSFLRYLLRAYLDARGFGAVEILFPPIEYCTDNAAMIAWCGVEMFEAGWRSELSCEPLRKWSLDPAVDGGILGAGDWFQVAQ